MQTIVSSGNPIVDAIGQINITGNIVPASWFRKITLGSGRPDTVAIIILVRTPVLVQAKKKQNLRQVRLNGARNLRRTIFRRTLKNFVASSISRTIK